MIDAGWYFSMILEVSSSTDPLRHIGQIRPLQIWTPQADEHPSQPREMFRRYPGPESGPACKSVRRPTLHRWT